MDLTRTNQTIRQFEACVRQLLREGKTIKEAVDIAYDRYPIMEIVRQEIETQIESEMQRGFGSPLPEAAMLDAMKKSWADDGLTLSQRTTRGRAEVVRLVQSALTDAVRNGNAMRDVAKTIYDGYGKGRIIPQQELAQYVQKLTRIWRQNQGTVDGETYESLLRQLRNVKRNYDRFTEDRAFMNHYRTALKELLDAVEEGRDKAVFGALRAATEEKSRYAAERIARTELARAYADGFMARWGPDEDCVAFRWKLSSRHPKADICDLYANADLYGLGKGVFPKWKVPMLPVHPHCMCHLVPLMDGQVDMDEMHDQVEEGGRAYIRRMKSSDRMNLLGRTGIKGVMEGGSWAKHARGYSRDVMRTRLNNSLIPDIIHIGEPLAYTNQGRSGFIPRNTVVEVKNIIAGAGTSTELRIAEKLVLSYGGTEAQWQKLVGSIESANLLFDIHWYHHPEVGNVGFKIKNLKEKR